jgi:hypothetical protein
LENEDDTLKEMGMSTAKYFSGATELWTVWPEKLARFRAIGGIPTKHNRYDGFSRMVGETIERNAVMPVTRTIFYKSNPSLHKCDGRCTHAKGHDCECSCGGKNHGRGE